ncbi:hypothetical protein [Alteribacter keqinensis]|uniref:Uncharacterized protein n=1 Tax=Alteribacter keqinensis TaxID=2483800 RepID=A0A3M7TW46_9BACI|nr:hypothetical protein [Alteribacter keqinensis]RNA69132.1 hypothetical protein EBO34_04040 [Alteribacter keqinensis]
MFIKRGLLQLVLSQGNAVLPALPFCHLFFCLQTGKNKSAIALITKDKENWLIASLGESLSCPYTLVQAFQRGFQIDAAMQA